MWYGDGRLNGNMGTYVVEEAKDKWDAERLIRQSTVSYTGVELPKKLKELTGQAEDPLWDAVEPSKRDDYLYHLPNRVHFLEFRRFEDMIGRNRWR